MNELAERPQGAPSKPYQLRPQKFVDRGLYFDLLSRLVSRLGTEKYLFLSMGASHLVDHDIAFRKLGMTSLCSFDSDKRVTSRQVANKPTHDTKCLKMHSRELPDRLEEIFDEFEGVDRLPLWLDYTDNKGRFEQLQEYGAILARMQDGDVLRITLNAHAGTIGNAEKFEKDGYDSAAAFRLDKLRDQLGEYVPFDAEPINSDNFASLLVRCIEMATDKAELTRNDITFKPLLFTTYADGHRMMTATILACSRETTSADIHFLKDWSYLAGS